ncbi:hypothetical protein [Streptomyces asiaticus]|uniref:hypothetical protein n=1 Tax=Streptomyces asiaticus TaxID=114695 RepID=UPI003F66158E
MNPGLLLCGRRGAFGCRIIRTRQPRSRVRVPVSRRGWFGSDGVFVGQDLYSGLSFVYDPWVLYARGLITAPNLVLAGIVGSGKSALAKSLSTRSIPFGRRVYVPGDPKGEHTAVAEAVGGKSILLGHRTMNRLNPLDDGHRLAGLDDLQWAAQVTARRRELVGALAETVLRHRRRVTSGRTSPSRPPTADSTPPRGGLRGSSPEDPRAVADAVSFGCMPVESF